jgi:hypothetical protein
MEASMSPDATSERLAQEIEEARDALIERAKEKKPEEWWRAYELKDRARNGWSTGAMNIAFRRLLDADVFEVDGDLIRLQR